MNNLHLLRDVLFKYTGVDLMYYNINFIQRRLEYRLRTTNLSFQDYLQLLKDNEKERDGFLKSLSINVTEFFRDKDVFILFATILKSMKKDCVNVWSVGCATGEEPYTISLIANKMNINCKIIAIDINKNAIQYARRGVYSFSSLSKIPSDMLSYFNIQDGLYAIKEEIKKNVRFEIADIFKVNPTERFDFIFCRNMMIYFCKDKKDMLIRKFYNALDDGYLILGKSESLLGESLKLFRCVYVNERFYKKL